MSESRAPLVCALSAVAGYALSELQRGDTAFTAIHRHSPSVVGNDVVHSSATADFPAAFQSETVSVSQPSLAPTCLTAAAATVAGLAAVGRARRRGPAKEGRGRRAVAVGRSAAPAEFKSMCKDSEPKDSVRRRMELILAEAQESICSAIEKCDGKATFDRGGYTRGEHLGGGMSRVLVDGNIFEKAGVNLSVVYGEMPQETLKAATERGVGPLKAGEKVPFFAVGLSSVMHPRNPHCPTMHFNYRYFETEAGHWWFGGGTDITPSYLDEEDMRHFHGTLKDVCDGYDHSWYPKFKAWADDYFRIAHRGETRGLGGIFFDDFNTEAPERHLAFAKDCLAAVPKAYIPILEKHRSDAFTQEQKEWQQIRRGRYVEFNLVYDRGTVFGLKMLPTGVGRVESILMSLPETARWQYNHEPAPGSEEARILDCFRTPRHWV